MGADAFATKQVKILIWKSVWNDGISFEANAMHAKVTTKETNAECMKQLTMPTAKEGTRDSERKPHETRRHGRPGQRQASRKKLGNLDIAKYGAPAARSNYLTIDQGGTMTQP